MRYATASCSTSLSFIFKACPNKDLGKMGSIGIGCTLDKQVETTVKLGKTTNIFFNKKPIYFPTVEYALSSLTTKLLTVEIKSPLPLGYGFGVSSAATLTSLFATNTLFALGYENDELIRLSHMAEIKNKTGLGSVATQVTGGFLIKDVPGIPVIQFTRLPFIGRRLYATVIDKLETPSVLKDKNHLKKINQAAKIALEQIKKRPSPSLEEIIDTAFHFAHQAQLLTNKKVISLIDKIRKTGGHATMAMLGQVVVSCEKPNIGKIYRIEELRITDNTVHIQ